MWTCWSSCTVHKRKLEDKNRDTSRRRIDILSMSVWEGYTTQLEARESVESKSTPIGDRRAMGVGSALASVKPCICPKLFEGGMPIHKVSTKGNIDPRVLTLSDYLFTLFIHPSCSKSKQSPSDKLRYKSYKAFTKVKSSVTASSSRGGGSSSQVLLKMKQDIRVIDVDDILFVQTGSQQNLLLVKTLPPHPSNNKTSYAYTAKPLTACS